MDDDLQNPPDQALVLIDEAMKGRDVVFGRFESKQAPGYRRIGSKLISADQPADLRTAARPRRLQLPDPAPRRRRPDLRVENGPPVHHRAGPDVLERPLADVLVRHDARPIGKSHYSLTRILRLVFSILFSYSLFPLRLAAVAGFVVALGSFVLGACYLVAVLHRGQLLWTAGPRIVVLLAIFNGVDDRAAVDARRVRHPNAQRGQHSGPTTSSTGSPRDPTPPGDRRAAMRHDVPAHDARRAPDRSPWPGRRNPEPKVFMSDEAPRAGWTWYRETYFAHADDERLLGEKSTSYLEDPERAGAGAEDARRDPRPRPFARPGGAGHLQLALQHRQRARDPPLWTTALSENLARPAGVGPEPHLRLAVRLPRARSLRRLPRPVDDAPSRRPRTCCSSRSSSPTGACRADLLTALGVAPDLAAAEPGPRVNQSPGAPPVLTRRDVGHTAGVLREEQPSLERLSRTGTALVNEAYRGARRDGRE